MPVVVSLRGWPLRDQIASVIAAITVYGVSHVNAMRARVHIRDSSPLENQTPSHLTPLNTARAVQEVTESISVHHFASVAERQFGALPIPVWKEMEKNLHTGYGIR